MTGAAGANAELTISLISDDAALMDALLNYVTS